MKNEKVLVSKLSLLIGAAVASDIIEIPIASALVAFLFISNFKAWHTRAEAVNIVP
jgi:hypothetical protein